jgi:hypothetical protein
VIRYYLCHLLGDDSHHAHAAAALRTKNLAVDSTTAMGGAALLIVLRFLLLQYDALVEIRVTKASKLLLRQTRDGRGLLDWHVQNLR